MIQFSSQAADLQEVVEKKLLKLKGIVGIYPANSVADDIEIYTDEDRREVQCRFFGLRQQAEKENDSEPYLCISDFIAPKASDVPDYLGLFANGTFGVEEMVAKYKADVRTLSFAFPIPKSSDFLLLISNLNIDSLQGVHIKHSFCHDAVSFLFPCK